VLSSCSKISCCGSFCRLKVVLKGFTRFAVAIKALLIVSVSYALHKGDSVAVGVENVVVVILGTGVVGTGAGVAFVGSELDSKT
jgi:hypothetical protein